MSFPEMELIGKTTHRKLSEFLRKDLSLIVAESSLIGHKRDRLGNQLFWAVMCCGVGSLSWRDPDFPLQNLTTAFVQYFLKYKIDAS